MCVTKGTWVEGTLEHKGKLGAGSEPVPPHGPRYLGLQICDPPGLAAVSSPNIRMAPGPSPVSRLQAHSSDAPGPIRHLLRWWWRPSRQWVVWMTHHQAGFPGRTRPQAPRAGEEPPPQQAQSGQKKSGPQPPQGHRGQGLAWHYELTASVEMP